MKKIVPSHRRFTEIEQPADIDAAVAESHQAPVVIFKHSATCGLSTRAHRQINKLALASDPHVYRVVVQTARAASNYAAHLFGVRHESPQIFVLSRGAVVATASHGRVTADAVRAAAAEHPGDEHPGDEHPVDEQPANNPSASRAQ